MQDYEKLGVFYLGRLMDTESSEERDEPLLYDARDLLTHAVCVGMTGSGKTGLGAAILEEAALDGIPAIAIDPKGDLGNLLLAFPELNAGSFRPWIDDAEAARRGVTPEVLAAETAEAWRRGLEASGQDGARVARFREAADAAIYTPGSSAGIPLSILRSLSAPPDSLASDADAFREKVSSSASGLLALLGIGADPLRSREHILLATLLERAWRSGEDADLPGLVRAIQSPPFDRVGVVDLESFFPSRERADLAMALNGLIAAPGFAAWTNGEPLDVSRLLWTASGKPRISVISIAHLTDAERMFLVTLLLNEIVAWVRAQPGTSSLRAILYMDEILGYFPPVADPPSKAPMLTLLKQARAFGLGVVLATQNPVDLDYKGLSNAGTWFLGRLQTERDKERVLEGLEGVRAAEAGFDRALADRLLAGLAKRTFLMSDVHGGAPVLFRTRWTLSFLRGPLTRPQIQSLMAGRRAPARPAAIPPPAALPAPEGGPAGPRQVLPPGIPERVLVPRGQGPARYAPALLGSARLHYLEPKSGVDLWEEVAVMAPLDAPLSPDPWDRGAIVDAATLGSPGEPEEGSSYAPLPPEAARAASYASWGRGLAEWLYRSRPLTLWRAASGKLVSRPGESEGDFRVRAAHAAREARDLEKDRLEKRYAPKIAVIADRIRRAEERTERERSQYDQQKLSAAISLGATVLGALFGRKAASSSNIGRAATAARSVGRAAQERADVARAGENVEALRQRMADLDAEFRAEAAALEAPAPDAIEIEPVSVRPRKSDLAVREVVLAWLPADRGAEG